MSEQTRSYLLVWAKYRLHDEDNYGDGYQDFLDYHAALKDALADIRSPDFPKHARTLHVCLQSILRPIVTTALDNAPYKNANAHQGVAQQGILDCAIDIAVALALDGGGGDDGAGQSIENAGADDDETKDDGEQGGGATGTANEGDADSPDAEAPPSRVYDYCNVFRLLLSPYNFLYREPHSTYMRTMPHLLPRCRMRLLPRVADLVQVATAKEWVGIGAFVGVVAAVVHCGHQAAIARNRRRRRTRGQGREEGPVYSDDDDDDIVEGSPVSDDSQAVNRSAMQLLRLMQRLATCEPEQLGIGTLDHEELEAVRGGLCFLFQCSMSIYFALCWWWRWSMVHCCVGASGPCFSLAGRTPVTSLSACQ